MKEIILELLKQRNALNNEFIISVHASYINDAKVAQDELERFDKQYNYLFKELLKDN